MKNKQGPVRDRELRQRSRNQKKEMRVLVCKECGCQVDEVGCEYDCRYDSITERDRKPETLELLVYVLDRVEPYP